MQGMLYGLLSLGLICCVGSGAQENGSWRAASKTATSITGDVAIGNEKIAISFSPYALAEIRPLTPAELGAVFGVESESEGARKPAGHLFRLSVPFDKKFLHKNTLCGGEETQWMATMVQGKTMQVAFFSGAKMPELTPESMQNSTELCGTFTYVR